MAGEKELRIKITANSAQFLNAVKGVNSSLGGLISTVGRFQMSAVGVVAGISSVAAGLAKIIKSTADYGDELYNTSQKIGISVEALSGLQYAAGLANIEHATLTIGIKKLSTAVVESSKELKSLGFTQSELGNLKTDELLLKLADRFRQMEDGAGKTALAVKLFGRSGIELIPLLNEGSAGIKKMTDEAKAFGLVIDEKAAKAADDFNDNLDRMKGLVMGITVSIGNELIPKINSLVAELEKAAKSEGWKILTPQGQAGWLFKRGIEAGERLGGGWRTGGTGTFGGPGTGKTQAHAVVDEAVGKAAKAAEDAAQKHKEWQFKMRAESITREQEANDLGIQTWIDSENTKWEWEQASADARIALEEKVTAAKVAAAQRQQEVIVGSLAFISRSALREHKAFFAITKAADMAQAVMDTYAAATKALATVPYPYNFAVAALVTAAGLANVQKIASTSFGGKGSGGGAAGSATSGAGVGAQGSTFVANQPTQSVQVVVHGNIIDHAAFVRELQPYFREVVVDTV